ncbi:hypothetical protein Tco_0761577 [Tanacetum coccineum]
MMTLKTTNTKTVTETSSVKSPLKVDKDWKEKFFHPANHVREEEPKKLERIMMLQLLKIGCQMMRMKLSLSLSRKFKSCLNGILAPRAVLMKTGLKSFNTARLVNTVRPVNTGRPFSTARPFRSTINTVRARGFNVVKPLACWVWRPIKPNGASLSNSQLNDKGFVDSGCLRHMTGNIAHLSDFKDFDGGYVTFGGGAYGGRITGKGTIKTDNLD